MLAACLGALLLCGCANSRFAIDASPVNPVDTSLFGIWRVMEDSDKLSFILVQSYYDLHKKAPLADSNSRYYYLTYQIHGVGSYYNQLPAFLSTIGTASFLNVDGGIEPKHRRQDRSIGGFFLARFEHVAPDTILTSTIRDSTLESLASSKEARDRIEQNYTLPGFYCDTVHYYKVSGYHYSLRKARKRVKKG